jgi:hypothetical protein
MIYVSSSLVIVHIECEDDVCVTWLYCDYGDLNTQTPANMIGALVRQAVIKLYCAGTLSYKAIYLLLAKKRRKKPLDLKEAINSLMDVLGQFPRSYICVDALDECSDEGRRSLLESLRTLSIGFGSTTSIRIFITARHHIGDHVNRYLIGESGATFEPMYLKANQNDIEKFVRYEIENDINGHGIHMDEEFKDMVVSKIVGTSNGMLVDNTISYSIATRTY